jgi:hypothetical protein
MMGSRGLTHWTSQTVYECSEIAGSPHFGKSLRRHQLHSPYGFRYSFDPLRFHTSTAVEAFISALQLRLSS